MYLDTSILIAFYVPEELSSKIHDLITNREDLFISSITKVEFLSAINKKVRMGFSTKEEARIAFRKFEEHISRGFYKQVEVNINHFGGAVELLLQTNTALRTLDAIHLGIVQKERLSIASNDTTLLKSAQEFNIPTVSI